MILFWCKFLDFYPSAERTTSLSNWRVLRNVVLFQFHIVRCCKKTCEQAVTWKNWKIHESFWWIFVCYSLFMCFGISNFSQSTWLNLKKGPFINYVTQIRTMFYPLPLCHIIMPWSQELKYPPTSSCVTSFMNVLWFPLPSKQLV